MHELVISASVAVNMERTKIQKLEIGKKIPLKWGEVGQIVNTESPLGFCELISRLWKEDPFIYAKQSEDPVTIHFRSESSSNKMPNKLLSSVFKTLEKWQ